VPARRRSARAARGRSPRGSRGRTPRRTCLAPGRRRGGGVRSTGRRAGRRGQACAGGWRRSRERVGAADGGCEARGVPAVSGVMAKKSPTTNLNVAPPAATSLDWKPRAEVVPRTLPPCSARVCSSAATAQSTPTTACLRARSVRELQRARTAGPRGWPRGSHPADARSGMSTALPQSGKKIASFPVGSSV
jgi:hypothetical protein